MLELTITIIISVITGILSSVLFLWLMYNHLSPKITFTNNIYKIKSESSLSGYKYLFGIKNLRNRDAVDLRLRCFFVIPDYPKNKVTQIPYIQLSTDNIFDLVPGGKKGISKNIKMNFNSDRLIDTILKREYSIDLVNHAKEQKVTPELFFKRFGDAYIRVTIYVTDGYSGFSRLYRSKKYTINDISLKGYGGYN